MDSEELDQALREMRDRGSSPIEVIKFIRDARGTGLREAKQFFSEHPVWAEVHEAAQPLQDSAEEALRRFANP